MASVPLSIAETKQAKLLQWGVWFAALICVASLLTALWGAIAWQQRTGLTEAEGRRLEAAARTGGPILVVSMIEGLVDAKSPAFAGELKLGLRRMDGSLVAGNLEGITINPPNQASQAVWSQAGATFQGKNLEGHSIPVPPSFELVVLRQGYTLPIFPALSFLTGISALFGLLLMNARIKAKAQDRYRARVAELVSILERTRDGAIGLRPNANRFAESDDLATLARLLGAMLDQLEKNLSNVQAWTSQAAHELRSRLSRLAPDKMAPQDQKIAFAQTLDMLNALLDLAHTGSSVDRRPSKIDVGDLLRRIATLYEDVAGDRNIQIAVKAKEVTLFGEEPLIERAIANLLDNALRYSPSGSKIELEWGGFGVGKLSVRDEGPGPRGRSLNQLVAQKERTDDHDGKRIGLRLVEAIALRHGGHVYIEDAHPGLKVVMEFPLQGRRDDVEVPYMSPPR